MNKGRRVEITKLKHLKRCKVLGLKPEEHYSYKAQAKPCSCFMCSPLKFKRTIKHKKRSMPFYKPLDLGVK